MNLQRKTFISDAVPPAGLGRGGHRRFDGGEPGDSKEYRLTQSEADAVRRERLSDLVDPDDGIIGMGACMDATTRRPCQHSAACMRDVLAGKPLVCHMRQATDNRKSYRAERTAATDAQINDILDYMRQHPEPQTFSDVCQALGYGAAPLLLSGAWKRMLHTGIIIAVGERVTRGHRHTHHVKTWIIAEASC